MPRTGRNYFSNAGWTPMNRVHLFGKPGEEIPSSEEVQDQVELPFGLERCKRKLSIRREQKAFSGI